MRTSGHLAPRYKSRSQISATCALASCSIFFLPATRHLDRCVQSLSQKLSFYFFPSPLKNEENCSKSEGLGKGSITSGWSGTIAPFRQTQAALETAARLSPLPHFFQHQTQVYFKTTVSGTSRAEQPESKIMTQSLFTVSLSRKTLSGFCSQRPLQARSPLCKMEPFRSCSRKEHSRRLRHPLLNRKPRKGYS